MFRNYSDKAVNAFFTALNIAIYLPKASICVILSFVSNFPELSECVIPLTTNTLSIVVPVPKSTKNYKKSHPQRFLYTGEK